MNMPCRVSIDELYNDLHSKEEQLDEAKHIDELSLYELGGQDFEVWLSKNNEGFILDLEADDGTVFQEKGLSDYAAEALADFCRHYLHCYDRLAK